MIELNLTYEESKKILELGYDFAPVCDRFIEELSRLKKPEYIEQEYFQVTIFRTEINQRMSDSLTPIIPKAALEACLPTTLSFGFNEDVYLMYEYCDKEFQYYQSPDYYCSDGKIYYSSKSAYEAFIWCHENYPEELGKKFEEVMG